MEQQIQSIVGRLKRHYYFFWAVPVLIILAGEFELLPLGSLVGNERLIYLLETIGILTIAICVPLSVKLFSWLLKNKFDDMPLAVALKQYVRWSAVRLALLEVAVLFNLYCYYSTMNSQGALCALIGLTTFFFCIPSEKRLRNELHLTANEE